MNYFNVIFTGVVPPRLQALAIAVSILLLVGIIQLIRKERLKEGYSIWWLAVAGVMLVFSVWADLLQGFAELVGVSYAPAALFLIIVGGLILLSLHFSLLLCRYDRRIRTLAQEHAMLKLEIEKKFRKMKV